MRPPAYAPPAYASEDNAQGEAQNEANLQGLHTNTYAGTDPHAHTQASYTDPYNNHNGHTTSHPSLRTTNSSNSTQRPDLSTQNSLTSQNNTNTNFSYTTPNNIPYGTPGYGIDSAASMKAGNSHTDTDTQRGTIPNVVSYTQPYPAAQIYDGSNTTTSSHAASVSSGYAQAPSVVYASVPVIPAESSRPESLGTSSQNVEIIGTPEVDWARVRTGLEYGRPFDDTCEVSAKTLGTGLIPFDKENAQHGSFRTSKFGTIDLCGSLLPLVTGLPLSEHHKSEVLKHRNVHRKINNRHNKWHRKECKDIEKEYNDREKQERKRQKKVLGLKKRQLDPVDDQEFIKSLEGQLMAKLCDKTTKVYNTIYAEERGCYLAIHELDRNELQSMDEGDTAALEKRFKKEKSDLKYKNVGNKMKAFVMHSDHSNAHGEIKENHKAKMSDFYQRKDKTFADLKAEQTRRVQLYNQLQTLQMHDVHVFYGDITRAISDTLAHIAEDQPFITMPSRGSLNHSMSLPAGNTKHTGGDGNAHALHKNVSQGASANTATSSADSPRVSVYSQRHAGRSNSLGQSMSFGSATSSDPRYSISSHQNPLHQTSVQEETQASAPPLDEHNFQSAHERTLPAYPAPVSSPLLKSSQSHDTHTAHTNPHPHPITHANTHTLTQGRPATHRRSSSASSGSSTRRYTHCRSNSGYKSPVTNSLAADSHAHAHAHTQSPSPSPARQRHSRSHSHSRSPQSYYANIAEQQAPAASPTRLSPRPRPPPPQRKPTPKKEHRSAESSGNNVGEDEVSADASKHTKAPVSLVSSRTPSPKPVPRPQHATVSTLQEQLDANNTENNAVTTDAVKGGGVDQASQQQDAPQKKSSEEGGVQTNVVAESGLQKNALDPTPRDSASSETSGAEARQRPPDRPAVRPDMRNRTLSRP